MTELKPFAFVLMPFRAEFDDIYQLGIKECAENLGIVAERVDEQNFTETILERIYRQIDACDFIIAEMTGQNPNVFYEVGYAHAKGKLCALITQNTADIPFDLKHHTHVVYDGRVVDLVDKLTPKLEWMLAEAKLAKERSFAVSHKAGSGLLEKSEYQHKGSFDLEVTVRNESERRSAEIEALYLITTRHWYCSTAGHDLPHDDYISDSGAKLRKHLVAPSVRRLTPSAFFKMKISTRRMLWSKWSGTEMKETYNSRGHIGLEIATSEGVLPFQLAVDVEFDEFPF